MEKLILPRFHRSSYAVIFHFPLRNLDIDRFRQAYEGTEWHNLYCMHTGSGERVSMERKWRLNGKGVCLIKAGGCFWVYRHQVPNPPVDLQLQLLQIIEFPNWATCLNVSASSPPSVLDLSVLLYASLTPTMNFWFVESPASPTVF